MLEFGRQRNLLAYILAANVITRRLHELWVKKTERYWNTKDVADRPRPLMITIEEAQATGLSKTDFQSRSFLKILEARRKTHARG